MRVAMKRNLGILLIAAGLTAGPVAAGEKEADARLDVLIERGIREGGSFFTAGERAVIEAKCGYAPGSWDGFQVNMIGDVLHCANGRRVDGPEVQAVMRAAAPRIERRVQAVMRRPEVIAAMNRVAREAEVEAVRELRKEGLR